MKPMRPVLRWHGGKWLLAPWVIEHFPRHRVYVEPFGGAASVLLRKERSFGEVYNDLDDQVVALFRILRDPAKASLLADAIRLTPFARREFEAAYEPADDEMEVARRLIVRAFMGFGSNAHSASSRSRTGFRANSWASGTVGPREWATYPDHLRDVVDRFRGVVVEHREALDCMRQHDGPETLHYVDPPYVASTRSPANKYDLKHRMYRHELTDADHQVLLAALCGLSGMVVLSGYPSPIYENALTDWRRVERMALADGARPRTEVLWLNPACAARLRREGVSEQLALEGLEV
ncbi:hypothetical protein GCM10011321_31660 [Youhaiella tibetensis]|uniref:DNA adenine methylase n=1 Tax=Paradevosia tibetensis TaxID=1447062 RepID=A0A5B9DIB6_9HYPH|nr:DNA adenine methylase [Youhaiella tibetensis]QEE18874.1 DNA adenine methylase [Youhaiella tibetensis]GGF38408.1 hypothetical protein GCM10011321_31660 [Youhaiella tibetensis]